MNTSKPIIGIPLSPQDGDAEDAPGTRQCGRRTYAQALDRAGGLPVFLPVLPGADVRELLARLDGLLLPGGGDVDPALFSEEPHPGLGTVVRELDDFEIALARAAAEIDLPVLGICRGAQVLNVARGGSLYQHIPAQIPGALDHSGNPRTEACHAIDVPAATQLARIIGAGRTGVNSTHHQAIRQVAGSLRVAATCPDDGVIEALEDPDSRFCIGVQFHPEEMGEQFAPLFSAFVSAARRQAVR